MKQQDNLYVPPRIEEVEFKTENGFAQSGSTEDFGNGTGSWD